MGYHRAGFEVVGVDMKPQKNYPFTFHCGDALEYLTMHGADFDVIHASPPCQAYSTMTKRWGRSAEHPDLVSTTRNLLIEIGRPYIIENVVGSPLIHPIRLCGSSFGLEVRRHRLFEMTHTPVFVPPCQHIGYALRVNGHPGGSSKRDPRARFGNAQEWRNGMGIDWMDAHELAEAIPPAYTEWIGKQLLAQLNAGDTVRVVVREEQR